MINTLKVLRTMPGAYLSLADQKLVNKRLNICSSHKCLLSAHMSIISTSDIGEMGKNKKK